MQIPICLYCNNQAELVKGDLIYPHREDLYDLNFWMCKPCNAYVGCHKPNKRRKYTGIEPLGRLANAELREYKSKAHKAFDYLWKEGHMTRGEAYACLAQELGISEGDCHIGEMDIPMCKKVIEVCTGIKMY